MNELKIPTKLETISLKEQTNYRLIEIGTIKDCIVLRGIKTPPPPHFKSTPTHF